MRLSIDQTPAILMSEILIYLDGIEITGLCRNFDDVAGWVELLKVHDWNPAGYRNIPQDILLDESGEGVLEIRHGKVEAKLRDDAPLEAVAAFEQLRGLEE